MVSVCPCYVHTETIVILVQKQMHDENNEHRHHSLQAKNCNLINVHIFNPGPQTSTHIHTTAEYARPMLYPHTHTHVQNSHLNIKCGRRNEQIPNSVVLHIFPIFPKVKKG